MKSTSPPTGGLKSLKFVSLYLEHLVQRRR